MTKTEDVLKELKKHSDPKSLEGMARFGINVKYALGVRIPDVRKIAKEIGKDHQLAIDLWKTKIHDARILASMVDEKDKVTEAQMESWVKDFNSWDLCDQCIMNLFEDTPFAYEKAVEWSKREEEYVRRAGFVLMARLAVSDKKADDREFDPFYALIRKYSTDERNFVKKAVNWAIRQIGKRNKSLNKKMIALSKELMKIDSKAAKWSASDALRELESAAVNKRLK